MDNVKTLPPTFDLGIQDMVGRRFRFSRQENGKLTIERELPSATWQHPDGTIQIVSPDSVEDGKMLLLPSA